MIVKRWEGACRIISPEQTWHAIQPMLPSAGITRVADLTWLDDIGIPTVQAVRPASLTLSVSQGKASTYRAAQVSAVMESLEGWHAENVCPELFSMAAKDLGPTLTYDPIELHRPPGSLYHPGAKLDWMLATTLQSGQKTWVPWAAVVVNVAVTDCWRPPMFAMTSNGLASGNSYDEAALHGLYEIMERHAVATAAAGSTMFEVSADDLATSDCANLVELIYRAGSGLRVARLDTWNGFYCFAAELTSPTVEVPFNGSGLHHDPNVALSRAITEAAQSRLTAISGAREDIPSSIYQRFARMHGYSATRRSQLTMPFAEPTPWHEGTSTVSLADLIACAATAIVAKTGTEPLAAVCDFRGGCVPVVKVIAPGLVSLSKSPMRNPL
jgi:ribosomal protein S12 methylthiotransferase accessory factor